MAAQDFLARPKMHYVRVNMLRADADPRRDWAGDASALVSGRPVFTDRDRRFLLGQRRGRDFTPKLWLRFIAWRFAVTVWLCNIALADRGDLLLAPKWLR
jgi:hypothetical protein